jgi:hypothetical protein
MCSAALLIALCLPAEAFQPQATEPEPAKIHPLKKAAIPSVETKQPKASGPQKKVSSVEEEPEDKQLAAFEARELSKNNTNITPANPTKTAVSTQAKPATDENTAERPAEQAAAEVRTELLKPAEQTKSEKESKDTPQPDKQETRSEAQKREGAISRHLVLSVALIILVAIFFKAYLLVVSRRQRKKSALNRKGAPTIATALENQGIAFSAKASNMVQKKDSLPPEEEISLDLASLILEASHLQPELPATYQALPDLNATLDFCPGSRDKLEIISLSSQQEATLSLVNGTRSISDLCAESDMMDYEVHRFLYLMVKAGVLK